MSGESINQYNRYYEKVDNNIYKLYYYPICSDDFKVHTIHKITGETNCDCLYKFEINKNLKLDDKLDFEFKDDISSIKYYFLKQLDEKHYPLYISDKFKKEIYWNIIG